MAVEKFCKDCKHSRFVEGQKATCESPKNASMVTRRELYLVTGVMPQAVLAKRGASCIALRIDRGKELNSVICGPDGNWWEAKET